MTVAATLAALLTALAGTNALADAPAPVIAPGHMARVGTVDARFQSYNVEMVEITGGRFWKPYDSRLNAPPDPSKRAGASPDRLADRPPTDLVSPRLRKLAAALGPAYLRISGTWANSTAVTDTDTAPKQPPAGFNGVVSRSQWRGAIDFARVVGAEIVTSFATSPGTRDAHGVWTPAQALRLLAITRASGGDIAAAEFMNEPDLAAMGETASGYDPAAYGRDFRMFRAFMARHAPHTRIFGAGAIGQTTKVSDLLAASGPGLDGVSYHHYGDVSQRCGGQRTADDALSDAWLKTTDRAFAFTRTLRDRFAPGKPIWLTETAETACGGNPWAATFADTFRYLDQLGRLARSGVRVVMHNTLAASDYALLDEKTFAPRPNYWGALLWRRLMGRVVLDSGVPIQAGLHVYAHCRRDAPGVALLVINTDRDAPHALMLAGASERYTLDAANLQDGIVRLNGRPLALGADDTLPHLPGVQTAPGTVTFAPATISFLAVPATNNPACR